MDKLQMCRVCLGEDIRLRSIVETHLQEMYESLVLMPLETKDRWPILACYLCCARLQNCYDLKRSCLRTEELLRQMLSCDELEPTKLQEIYNKKRLTINNVVQLSLGHVLQMSAGNVGVEALMYNDVKVEQSDPEDIDEDALQENNVYDNIQSADSDNDPLINVKEEHSGGRTNVDEDALAENSVYDNIQSADSDDDPLIIVKEEQSGDRTRDLTSKGSEGAAQRNSENVTSSNLHEQQLAQNMFKEFNKVTAADKTPAKSSNEDTGQRPHQCHVCEKRFSFMSHLSIHMRTHTGEKPYHCDICKKQYSLKCNLSDHMRTHTGEKPYECHICKKSFLRMDRLSRHMRRHTGDKPYHCDICKKQFSIEKTLTVHMRTHPGEKPYLCDICKKQCSGKSSLNEHMRTHTSGKPYVCYVCERGFIGRHICIKTS